MFHLKFRLKPPGKAFITSTLLLLSFNLFAAEKELKGSDSVRSLFQTDSTQKNLFAPAVSFHKADGTALEISRVELTYFCLK